MIDSAKASASSLHTTSLDAKVVSCEPKASRYISDGARDDPDHATADSRRDGYEAGGSIVLSNEGVARLEIDSSYY